MELNLSFSTPSIQAQLPHSDNKEASKLKHEEFRDRHRRRTKPNTPRKEQNKVTSVKKNAVAKISEVNSVVSLGGVPVHVQRDQLKKSRHAPEVPTNKQSELKEEKTKKKDSNREENNDTSTSNRDKKKPKKTLDVPKPHLDSPPQVAVAPAPAAPPAKKSKAASDQNTLPAKQVAQPGSRKNPLLAPDMGYLNHHLNVSALSAGSLLAPLKSSSSEDIFNGAPKTFEGLAIHPRLISRLSAPRTEGGLGLEKPTRVQSVAIGPILQGRNTFIKSQTGSGKVL
jgi:hypothetical protein